MALKPLGRRAPSDWRHVEKYPLTAAAPESFAAPTPVVIGVNWYTDFDRPVFKSNAWWIGLDSRNLGSIRGGHCVCIRPHGAVDLTDWWTWFNQVSEGICVGEGTARAITLVTRKRVQPRPIYDSAQLIDEYSDTPPAEGTSVRAGLNIALNVGVVTASPGEPQLLQAGQETRQPNFKPLASYHWATSMDQVSDALSLTGSKEYVVIVNSWGRDYPHFVRMPLATLDRLRQEDGELAVPIFA